MTASTDHLTTIDRENTEPDNTNPLMPRQWIHPHARRFYQARLFQNLFGQWELEQAWGSLTSRHGRLVYVPIASLAEGQRQLAAVARRRAQRGYVLV